MRVIIARLPGARPIQPRCRIHPQDSGLSKGGLRGPGEVWDYGDYYGRLVAGRSHRHRDAASGLRHRGAVNDLSAAGGPLRRHSTRIASGRPWVRTSLMDAWYFLPSSAAVGSSRGGLRTSPSGRAARRAGRCSRALALGTAQLLLRNIANTFRF